MGGKQEAGILLLLMILAAEMALGEFGGNESRPLATACSGHYEVLQEGRPLVFCTERELLEWAGDVGLGECRGMHVSGANAMLRIGDDGKCTVGRIPAAHAMMLGQAFDINGATASDLEQLPGIGPRLARRIIELRKSLGCFCRPEQLLDVKGIGSAKLAKISRLVSFGDCKCDTE